MVEKSHFCIDLRNSYKRTEFCSTVTRINKTQKPLSLNEMFLFKLIV